MLRTLSQTMLFLVAAAVFGSAASAQDDGYRINGGACCTSRSTANRFDKDVPVQPDGGVAFPLVGNLNARGMTLKELQGQWPLT